MTRILRWAGGDPLKITVGTALLTLLVALDGDGASTFLITVSALLPIYQRLGMRRIVLTGVICLAAGVMNMVPWGGPTARAMAVLNLDSGRLFVPVLPAMVAGILWVLVAAYLIGRAERKRLGVIEVAVEDRVRPTGADRVRFWINVILTLALVVCLLTQLADLEVLFLLAFLAPLLVNRPTWSGQQELLTKHAYNVVLVIAVIFAAGGVHWNPHRHRDDQGDGRESRVDRPGLRRRAAAGGHRDHQHAVQPGVHSGRVRLRRGPGAGRDDVRARR
ncbi:SLC13 family permease [Saccharopolyspora hattusasensis]|uniref:SLC13 family permease n=1 Tax=Saccharopolyspora hattusasensis TaxID=1128679 RepID=UPI003D98F467